MGTSHGVVVPPAVSATCPPSRLGVVETTVSGVSAVARTFRRTRQLRLSGRWGDMSVGGNAPISVQSMTTTYTHDVDATLEQIHELATAGCDIIRIACPTQKDADALSAVVAGSPIPVITDIHFQAKYVFASIEAGVAGVRINPGNIAGLGENLQSIVDACKASSTPLRIGVNAGSLDQKILEKYNYKATPEALVESAVAEAREFEKLGFYDFAISVKHHDPLTTVKAYELLSDTLDYPLHLGVTEAGPAFAGTIKSATTFGTLLNQGIGDTIRVSLSADPVEEVKVGVEILRSLGLRKRDYEIISCPTCGRKEADVIALAAKIEPHLANHPKLKDKGLGFSCAVMGCIVNGPGEAREADIGIAGGRNHAQLFVKGETIAQIPHSEIISELSRQIDLLID